MKHILFLLLSTTAFYAQGNQDKFEILLHASKNRVAGVSQEESYQRYLAQNKESNTDSLQSEYYLAYSISALWDIQEGSGSLFPKEPSSNKWFNW